LPSDVLLAGMQLPLFHLLFQLMIFSALLESGASAVHAVNQRIDGAWRRRGRSGLTHKARLAIAFALLVGCMLLAGRFGLVALIAGGYRVLGYLMLATFVLPLITVGAARVVRGFRGEIPETKAQIQPGDQHA
jgi:uncharacterized membrane protein YkvI